MSTLQRILSKLFLSVILISYVQISFALQEKERETISKLSSEEISQLKKNRYASKSLLQRLHFSKDKGVSAARQALAELNKQDKAGMSEYSKIRNDLKSLDLTESQSKSDPKQRQNNIQKKSQLRKSMNGTKKELLSIYTAKMQLVEMLASAEDATVISDLIESSRVAHTESLVHQSVFVGLAEFGASSEATSYAQEVLDDPNSGVAKLVAALMYLTYYPAASAKTKAEEFSDPDYHPYIRDMASWLFAKLEGAGAKEKVIAAIEKSYIDAMGIESKYFGLLALAEIVEPKEFENILVGKDYPSKIYQSARRYSEFKHGDTNVKERLIRDNLKINMRDEEQIQALAFIFQNGRTDLLVELNILIENNDGLSLIDPFALQMKQNGYRLTGTFDNPQIVLIATE